MRYAVRACGNAINAWLAWAARSRLRPFVRAAKMVRTQKNQRKSLTRFAIEARGARPPSLEMPFVCAHRGLSGDSPCLSRFTPSRPLFVQPGAGHEVRKPGVYTPQIKLRGLSLYWTVPSSPLVFPAFVGRLGLLPLLQSEL